MHGGQIAIIGASETDEVGVLPDRAMIQLHAEGSALDPARTRSLTDLISGASAGRENDGQLTLYKSVGTALQDVIAADLVYRRARELGLGLDVPDLCQEKQAAGANAKES